LGLLTIGATSPGCHSGVPLVPMVFRAFLMERCATWKSCGINDDPILWLLRNWTKCKFLVRKQRPSCSTCKRCGGRKSQCGVWEQGKYPHVGQNTNVAIESYHSNLKSILNLANERFVGRRMNWLIYHLIGEVLTHYWYGVECKAFGYVRNHKYKGIVASAITHASTISIC
jgi:hypothetical protein